MSHQRKTRRTIRSTLGMLERLEDRIALSADGLVWGDAPFLTLSFAPDGTDIDGRPNQLNSYMGALGSEDDWQQTIISAFETWAIETNGDVGEVADDGSAFGVSGEMQTDPRFGDIRIGAIPMRDTIYAAAVSRGFVGGTWSGDVFFNTNVALDNLDEVFRVALHEAGHVFGFDDNDDPNSVMHREGIPSVFAPSVSDLDELYGRFGTRAPDINEREEHNDRPMDATDLDSDDTDGTTPIIAHGDIGTTLFSGRDVDYYRFDAPEDDNGGSITGPVTFKVRTSGLSQLDPRITIRDSDGNFVTSSQQQASDGSVTVHLQLTDPNSNGRHYVHIEAANGAVSDIGSYALIVTFDDLLMTSTDAIDRFSGPEFRFLEADDIQDIFEGDTEGLIPMFGIDNNTNDTLATATPLDPLAGFEDGAKYGALASISDGLDLDYYQIETVEGMDDATSVMSILLESLDEAPLDASVDLLDATGNAISSIPVLRFEGRSVVQFANLVPSEDHYIRIQAHDPSGANAHGNYRLTAISGSETHSPNVIATSTSADKIETFSYHAPRAQLVSFALDGAAGIADIPVTVKLMTAQGETLTEFSGEADRFFGAEAIMLDRGGYRIEVTHGGASGTVNYDLLAAIITDPLAVPREKSDVTPITQIPDFDDVFVFPEPGSGQGDFTDPGSPGTFRLATSWTIHRGHLKSFAPNGIPTAMIPFTCFVGHS